MPAYQIARFFTLNRLLCAMALAGLLLLSPKLFAVTLGEEYVLSFLGDPIEVEIDVLQWEDIDFDRVEIAVASAAEYDTFDLSFLPILPDLKFNLIGPNAAGAVKVLISTREPVVEPYIELLLVMRWPGGSLLREYVLLFDLPGTFPTTVTQAAPPETDVPVIDSPPANDTSVSFAVVSAELPAVPSAAPVNEVESPERLEAKTQAAIEVETLIPVPAQQTAAATDRRVYQVEDGDILWNVAQQFLPAGAADNIYQMLLSMHDLNRSAFINGNISLLKANALIQIPSLTDIDKVAADTAQALFEQRWQEGTQRMDAARNDQPLPQFTALNAEARVESEPELERPAAAIGVETGARTTAQSNSLILPSTTTAVVPMTSETANAGDLLISEADADPGVAGAGQITVTTLTTIQAPATEPDAATYNPYLEQINDSARQLQTLLQARSLQIAQLEQQVVEMRIRMRDAQEVAAALNETLSKLLLTRTQRDQAYSRNTTLLGSLALVMLVALLLAIVMILKLTDQLRSQHKLLRADVTMTAEMDAWMDNPQQRTEPVFATSDQRDTPIVAAASGIEVRELSKSETLARSEVESDEILQQELLGIIAIQPEANAPDDGKT